MTPIRNDGDLTPLEGVDPPHTSYVLWFCPRSGSNLLCDSMRFTGCAGNPSAMLSPTKVLNLLSHYEVDSHEDAQRALWRAGTTDGVFGMKCQMMNPQFEYVTDALRHFPGGNETNGHAELWSNAFPNCHHIAVTRRNKIRQAVSWYRATISKEWTREPGAPGPIIDVTDRYDKASIQHYMIGAVMTDAMMADFFTEMGVVPHVVVYEDFIADRDATVQGIFDYLGLDYGNAQRHAPILHQQADELSEEWVQRFRADQQVGWQRRW